MIIMYDDLEYVFVLCPCLCPCSDGVCVCVFVFVLVFRTPVRAESMFGLGQLCLLPAQVDCRISGLLRRGGSALDI